MPSISPSMREAPERLKCPEHFERRMTEAGGLNRYGQPNFRLTWAQTETTRQGGEWDNEDGYFLGYRDVLVGDGLPHWMLLQWMDAGKSYQMPHLTPQSDFGFYAENRDPKNGLQILGEYPYRGSYQIVLPLVAKWFLKGVMHVEAFPLSTEIVEMMVPIIKASMELSVQAKMKFLKEQDEQDELERTKAFDDAYHSIQRKPSLASTKWLEDKQRAIERAYNAALVTMLSRNRSFNTQGRLNAELF